MICDLFEVDVQAVRLAPGAMLLGGFALRFEAASITALRRVVEVAPFRHMVTPRGHRMSVAMTNCGAAGWVTDRTGYRYDSHDPQTGRRWPAMPDVFADLAAEAAARAGFEGFAPDACLINRYEPGARCRRIRTRTNVISRLRSCPSLSGCRWSSRSADCVEPTGRVGCRWLMETWSSGAFPPASAITASCRSRRDIIP